MSLTGATTVPARGTADPVRAVSVVSTGTVEIHPEQPYGTSKPLYWWLLTSRRWTPPRPINAYIIEHAKGLILFDTGQDRTSVTDDSYFPGGFTGYLYDRLARSPSRRRTPSPRSSRGSAQSSGGFSVSTSLSRDCSGTRSASNRPATPPWRPSPSRWTSWAMVRSSCSRRPVTPRGRCRC